ncbi:uncharacterized protein A1O5_08541 [Cladophialophora psammophila CBS 110553]|uniref:Major facilitator superfamily (MFS) profile domain-containing protein n=1 Tax=Cladophialophora psammophila CBS 110553 TaxID=1182543 RepID=W9WKR9_9EURO|nr:uncharacterized protein A1O5_08541 [Cladophialophora psammophila CBS 110553]EXJ68747.1 hypothetical protein A1O5_08541 [Cladophialophora psammophila CBS 110553]
MAHVEKDSTVVSEHREKAVDVDLACKVMGVEGTDVRTTLPKSKEEKALVRKADILILPLLSGSILFAYLDRGNIGNARIMGLQEDINLSNGQYFNCLMMFFLGYMLVEFGAGLLLRIFPPRFVIGGAILCFGTVACCMAAVKGYAPLMILRVLLGLAEGTGYNVYLYTSLWYKPYELSKRTAAVYGMSPLAGAFSGLFAYGVQRNLDGAKGYHAWQWLFIIEGVLTIAWALLIIAILPALPDTVAAKGSFIFPHEGERRIIAQRMREGQNTEGSKIRLHQVWIGLKDPKLYLGSLMIGGLGIIVGGFSVFLPTFIKEFGFSSLQTQLYSIIPYAFGFVSLVFMGFVSDYLKHKAWIIFGCFCVVGAGYVVLLATTNKVALMAGLCIILTGLYPGVIVSVAWINTMHGGFTKRALAIWFSQIFIQGYSIIASQVYTTPPRFYKGHGVGISLCALAMISTAALYVIMKRANTQREQRARDFAARGEIDPLMEKDFEDLCDFHPAWRYPL